MSQNMVVPQCSSHPKEDPRPRRDLQQSERKNTYLPYDQAQESLSSMALDPMQRAQQRNQQQVRNQSQLGFQTNHSHLNQDEDEHHIQELISLSNNPLEPEDSPNKMSSFKNKSSNYQYSVSGMNQFPLGSPPNQSPQLPSKKAQQPKQDKVAPPILLGMDQFRGDNQLQ